MKESDHFSKKLEAAYQAIANIIDKYGEIYLPIFRRLHEEREKYKEQQDLMTIVKAIADKSKNN